MNTLDSFLNLPYKLEIVPVSEEDGGGFYASYPELGKAAAHGDGATVEEAVRMANEAKRLVIETKLDHGDQVPLPRSIQEYSGKFNVRVPKSLHRNLSELAEKEGVSLNQLVVTLLSGGVNRLERR